MLVHPLGVGVHVNKERPLRGAFLVVLECGIQVFLPTVAMQRQPNPTFTQHGKIAERSDRIRV
jgi:hypothetical protein